MSVENWRIAAKCLGKPPSIFIHPPGERGLTITAKSMCNLCPVKSRCLQEALALGVDLAQGIWGGTDEKDRLRMLALLGPNAAAKMAALTAEAV